MTAYNIEQEIGFIVNRQGCQVAQYYLLVGVLSVFKAPDINGGSGKHYA